jgi:hypothetical protein
MKTLHASIAAALVLSMSSVTPSAYARVPGDGLPPRQEPLPSPLFPEEQPRTDLMAKVQLLQEKRAASTCGSLSVNGSSLNGIYTNGIAGNGIYTNGASTIGQSTTSLENVSIGRIEAGPWERSPGAGSGFPNAADAAMPQAQSILLRDGRLVPLR